MQHHFAVEVEKKQSAVDPTRLRGIFHSDSNRMSKVAKKFREWAIRTGLVVEDEIENIYLQQLK